MKHWIGVLLVAAALAVSGVLVPADAADLRGGLLGLAGLLTVIALFKLAGDLIQAD